MSLVSLLFHGNISEEEKNARTNANNLFGIQLKLRI